MQAAARVPALGEVFRALLVHKAFVCESWTRRPPNHRGRTADIGGQCALFQRKTGSFPMGK